MSDNDTEAESGEDLAGVVRTLRQDIDALTARVDTHVVHPVVTEPVEEVTKPVVEPVVETVEKVTPPPREEKPTEESPKRDTPSHGMSTAWFG